MSDDLLDGHRSRAVSEQPLWVPSADYQASTQLADFMAFVAGRQQLVGQDYTHLHRWSIEQPAQFWAAFWDWADIVADIKGDAVAGGEIPPHVPVYPRPEWFPEARLNFAENLLRPESFSSHHASGGSLSQIEGEGVVAGQAPAVVFRAEPGMAAACGLPASSERRCVSFARLTQQVERCAAALLALGIEPGDRVAAYMPNVPETLIAMLASARIGAVWSSCSQDFGVPGLLDRFGQIQPRVLFTTDGYYYHGKIHPRLDQVASACTQMPSLQQVVVIPYVSAEPDIDCLVEVAWLPPTCRWDEFLASAGGAAPGYRPLPFDHPLYIVFSSGTTGQPKCIVHGAGGTLLQHVKEHRLHTDLRPGEVLFYYTTCGWMMWNWLVSGLASGATLLLYDGCPTAPTAGVLMDIAAEEGVSVFGTSARYLSALQKAGVRPAESHALPKLRALLSTGSPLSHEGFEYVYRDIKADLMLSSISGGTDILSCFALGCPLRPVYRGQLQCAGLGMAVAVFDEQGRSLQGEKGELVCTRPFPSMPLGFWNDGFNSPNPGADKYRAAYFERFPGVWAHGDYAEHTPEDGFIIHGRSDAVLNPGGVRIGTAEIYREVEKVDAVLESLCIGQPWRGDERIVLFVRLRPGERLGDELKQQISEQIRLHCTPRHVPAKIIQVDDIPRTLSGKIVELAVRQVVSGQAIANVEALANPEALAQFRDRPELTD